MWVRSLGWDDPLEEDMVTHSNVLNWRLPGTEKPGGLYSLWGCKESETTEETEHAYQLAQAGVWLSLSPGRAGALAPLEG